MLNSFQQLNLLVKFHSSTSVQSILKQVQNKIVKEKIMGKLSILSELWDFLKVRKKWWLAPILILLLLLGGLIILTQGSALAPFIYAIF